MPILEFLIILLLIAIAYDVSVRRKKWDKSTLGQKHVQIILSEKEDKDLIKEIRGINDKSEFFKRAARAYLSENRLFNSEDDDDYN
jgi:hypothetical protein